MTATQCHKVIAVGEIKKPRDAAAADDGVHSAAKIRIDNS